MQEIGSGGVGAVSHSIGGPLVWLFILAVLVAVLLGVWKLVKLLWAALS